LDSNIFICFACGVQGNSLQIIAQQEGITVRDAKEFAERIVGEGYSKVSGKHLSGRSLPKKQGYSNRNSTAGAIRRSRRG
jgi:DNA primase